MRLNDERQCVCYYFDPSEKHSEGNDVIELNLPVGEKFEISETILILQ